MPSDSAEFKLEELTSGAWKEEFYTPDNKKIGQQLEQKSLQFLFKLKFLRYFLFYFPTIQKKINKNYFVLKLNCL